MEVISAELFLETPISAQRTVSDRTQGLQLWFWENCRNPLKEKIPLPALRRAESFYVTGDVICSKWFAF